MPQINAKYSRLISVFTLAILMSMFVLNNGFPYSCCSSYIYKYLNTYSDYVKVYPHYLGIGVGTCGSICYDRWSPTGSYVGYYYRDIDSITYVPENQEVDVAWPATTGTGYGDYKDYFWKEYTYPFRHYICTFKKTTSNVGHSKCSTVNITYTLCGGS